MHPESPQPLQQSDLYRLDQFLRSEACGNQAMSLSYAHGFMTSVASGPESPQPLQQSDLYRLDQFLRSEACGNQAMSLWPVR
jgi:hypothetical protein